MLHQGQCHPLWLAFLQGAHSPTQKISPPENKVLVTQTMCNCGTWDICKKLTIKSHFLGNSYYTNQVYSFYFAWIFSPLTMQFRYILKVGLERMSELLRVREPWLKFGHEYSPYQSSDGSRISYSFQTTVHWIR